MMKTQSRFVWVLHIYKFLTSVKSDSKLGHNSLRRPDELVVVHGLKPLSVNIPVICKLSYNEPFSPILYQELITLQ